MHIQDIATQVVTALSPRFINKDHSIKPIRVGVIAFLVQVIIDKNRGTIYTDVADLEKLIKCPGLTINRHEGMKMQAICNALANKKLKVDHEKRDRVMTFWLSRDSMEELSSLMTAVYHRHVPPEQNDVVAIVPVNSYVEREPLIYEQIEEVEDSDQEGPDSYMMELAIQDPGARNLPTCIQPEYAASDEQADAAKLDLSILAPETTQWYKELQDNEVPLSNKKINKLMKQKYEVATTNDVMYQNNDGYRYTLELEVHQQREKVSTLDLETKKEETVAAKIHLERTHVEQNGQTERTKMELEFKHRQLDLEFAKIESKKKHRNSTRSERSERSNKKRRRASESDVSGRLLHSDQNEFTKNENQETSEEATSSSDLRTMIDPMLFSTSFDAQEQ